ncbi:alpha/beta fold hydrolase [Sciscionella marina]|nr:hypothetical protein [Sciscionella marina]
MLREIAGTVPDGRLIVVPGTAHLLNAEDPDSVNAALGKHLENCAVPRG